MKQYDIIGDIHGHADALIALLKKLGYQNKQGLYQHDTRTAIFLADFIDRGPKQKEVLDIVRPMIENKSALAVMANHEFNAICYATKTGAGYVRPHTDKNTRQHQAFLDAFPFGSTAYQETIKWFKTLPIYLDLPGLGVVHACWCHESFKNIQPFLNKDNSLTENAYLKFADESSTLFTALERVLKGPEYLLPESVHIVDKDGHRRKAARILWWEDAQLPSNQRLDLLGTELNIEQLTLLDNAQAPETIPQPSKPTFVGHYWLQGHPKALSRRVACLDYSVAKQGRLVAYRWNGEDSILNNQFIYV